MNRYITLFTMAILLSCQSLKVKPTSEFITMDSNLCTHLRTVYHQERHQRTEDCIVYISDAPAKEHAHLSIHAVVRDVYDGFLIDTTFVLDGHQLGRFSEFYQKVTTNKSIDFETSGISGTGSFIYLMQSDTTIVRHVKGEFSILSMLLGKYE
jgi:hypothetical protein